MARDTARRRKQATHITRLFDSDTRLQQAMLEAMDQQGENHRYTNSVRTTAEQHAKQRDANFQRNTDLIYYSPEPVTLLVPETPRDRTCYLLDLLPPELRNSIYEYTLTEDSGEVSLRLPYRHLDSFGVEQKVKQHDKNNAFALQYTCKRIWNECSDLVYQYNTIRFECSNSSCLTLPNQLDQIAKKQYKTRTLQKVHLGLDYMGSFETQWSNIASPIFWLAQNTSEVRISFRLESGGGNEALWNVKVRDGKLEAIVMPFRCGANRFDWQRRADEVVEIVGKTFSMAQMGMPKA